MNRYKRKRYFRSHKRVILKPIRTKRSQFMSVIEQTDPFYQLAGEHHTFSEAKRLASQFALSDLPVFITGEVGTGKNKWPERSTINPAETANYLLPFTAAKAKSGSNMNCSALKAH